MIADLDCNRGRTTTSPCQGELESEFIPRSSSWRCDLFFHGASLVGASLVSPGFGTLDAASRARASSLLPALPVAAGLVAHYAFVSLGSNSILTQ